MLQACARRPGPELGIFDMCRPPRHPPSHPAQHNHVHPLATDLTPLTPLTITLSLPSNDPKICAHPIPQIASTPPPATQQSQPQLACSRGLCLPRLGACHSVHGFAAVVSVCVYPGGEVPAPHLRGSACQRGRDLNLCGTTHTARQGPQSLQHSAHSAAGTSIFAARRTQRGRDLNLRHDAHSVAETLALGPTLYPSAHSRCLIWVPGS